MYTHTQAQNIPGRIHRIFGNTVKARLFSSSPFVSYCFFTKINWIILMFSQENRRPCVTLMFSSVGERISYLMKVILCLETLCVWSVDIFKKRFSCITFFFFFSIYFKVENNARRPSTEETCEVDSKAALLPVCTFQLNAYF